MTKWYKTNDARAALGVSTASLRAWDKKGKIRTQRTAGGQRRYDVDAFLDASAEHTPATAPGVTPSQLEAFVAGKKAGAAAKQEAQTRRFVYCRVSSAKQKDDLARQVAAMREAYPTHEIIQDVGSGLNFKRRGLTRLLDACSRGHVDEVVVAHRDRLCRFGIDWLRWFFRRHSVTLVVCDDNVHSVEQELVEDLMAVVHVFSCRLNGKRRYTKTIPRAKDEAKIGARQTSGNVNASGREGETQGAKGGRGGGGDGVGQARQGIHAMSDD
jgi:putative resolvase